MTAYFCNIGLEDILSLKLNPLFTLICEGSAAMATPQDMPLPLLVKMARHQVRWLPCNWGESFPPFYYSGTLDLNKTLNHPETPLALKQMLVRLQDHASKVQAKDPMLLITVNPNQDTPFPIWLTIGHLLGVAMPEPMSFTDSDVQEVALSELVKAHFDAYRIAAVTREGAQDANGWEHIACGLDAMTSQPPGGSDDA
jgi:hypothetical protein